MDETIYIEFIPNYGNDDILNTFLKQHNVKYKEVSCGLYGCDPPVRYELKLPENLNVKSLNSFIKKETIFTDSVFPVYTHHQKYK